MKYSVKLSLVIEVSDELPPAVTDFLSSISDSLYSMQGVKGIDLVSFEGYRKEDEI